MTPPSLPDLRDGWSLRHILRNGIPADFEVIPHSAFQSIPATSEGDTDCRPAAADFLRLHSTGVSHA